VITEAVRAHREKVVLDHFREEVAQDWDAVLSTFPHPRYEIVPTQRVYDGDAAVRGYYHDTRMAFPDQRHEIIALRHSDDAVVVEFHLLGTHLGPFGPVPPTGAAFKFRCTAFFVFDENEELVTERVYFDQLTLIRQLLGAIDKRSPKGILTLMKAVRGLAALSGQPRDVIPG
jgi:steroid delta-isomerase-like uncharacterized protein